MDIFGDCFAGHFLDSDTGLGGRRRFNPFVYYVNQVIQQTRERREDIDLDALLSKRQQREKEIEERNRQNSERDKEEIETILAEGRLLMAEFMKPFVVQEEQRRERDKAYWAERGQHVEGR